MSEPWWGVESGACKERHERITAFTMFWLPGTHLGRCAGNGSAICHRRTTDHRKRKLLELRFLGLDIWGTPPHPHLPTHPKELTTCHLKPAHCFYSMQMFSSILSPVSPPPLPFYPRSPSQTFFFFQCVCECEWGGERTSMTCSLVINFRSCLFFFCFRYWNNFVKQSTYSHLIHTDARRPAKVRSSHRLSGS